MKLSNTSRMRPGDLSAKWAPASCDQENIILAKKVMVWQQRYVEQWLILRRESVKCFYGVCAFLNVDQT